MTRYDLLARWDDRPALRDMTYAQLDSASARVAGQLAALGVGQGDRVATTLPAGPDFAALLHATPRLGAVLTPLNTRLSEAERRWQLEDCGARITVAEPLDGDEAGFEDRFDPAAPHTLLYTSGTTARPKQVLLTWHNHEASAIASAWNLGVDPGDRWLCVLPVFHVGGLAILLRSAIYGTAAVVHESFDEQATLDALAGDGITLVSLVPTMLRRLIDAGLDEAPALRAALLGGGPVQRDLLEWSADHGFPAVQSYGMTETSSQVVTLGVEEALGKSGFAGRPLPGVHVDTGDDGEILVRGEMVSRAALADDGWLHTGDRGRVDSEGFLWVEGRIKDVIVSGGENVSVAEVEEALLAHPAVSDCAVAGRPDPEWGEAVHAWIVMEGEPDLEAHLRDRLAPYKQPKKIHRVSEIPRTAMGKIKRSELTS